MYKCPLCRNEYEKRILIGQPRYLVVIDGAPVKLFYMETRILRLLVQNWGHLVSGGALGDILDMNRITVGVHINSMRKKLFNTALLINSCSGPGGGYWLRWQGEPDPVDIKRKS